MSLTFAYHYIHVIFMKLTENRIRNFLGGFPVHWEEI